MTEREFFTWESHAHELQEVVDEVGLAELAEKAGVGQRFIWELCHGQARPEWVYIVQIWHAVGVSPSLYLQYSDYGDWLDELSDPDSNEIPEEFARVNMPPIIRGRHITNEELLSDTQDSMQKGDWYPELRKALGLDD